MKISLVEKNGISSDTVELVSRLVGMVPWPARRQAMADVVRTLLAGKVRVAEDVFGWNRAAVTLGVRELQTGITCMSDLSKRRKPKAEEKYPQMLADIHAIMDSESQADPHLRTTLAYTNKTASAVRKALLDKGWPEDTLPKRRTISNILNRHRYRLRTVAKTRVQKKLPTPTPYSRTFAS